MSLLWLPLAAQGIVILVDEFYFHRRRAPLPLWERIGHPLDTLSVIAVVLFGLHFYSEDFFEAGYLMLSLISCVFITKDEWIHARHSPSGEHWLHSLLFVLHPVTFMCLFLAFTNPMYLWLVWGHLAILTVFFLYQVVRGVFP